MVIPIRKDEKEVIQAQLDNEKEVLKRIEENYKDALEEINSKIAELMGRADADMKHVVYQVDYQKNLKKQVETILETLHSKKFETVSEYLTTCYNEGFLGTLYSLQKQGVPLAIPINQEEVAAAIQLETKLSTSLYEAFDMKDLQKKIASEISRGFSTGAMYSEIARNVASYARIDKNKSIRIVRTEGHRITEAAAYNAQVKAKERGADIVKIWSAALDAKTRPSHMRVDGEIKELEKKFSNGLMYPGDPSGAAAEVVNCRCRSRSDARWALDAESTKMLGNVSEMSDKRKQEVADKLGIPVEDLEQYSGQIVPVRAKSYSDFKKQYDQLWHYEGSDLQKEAEERIKSYGKKTKTSTKSLENSANSSTMNTKQINRKIKDGTTVVNPMDASKYQKLKANLEKQGIRVIQAEGDDLKYLQALGAEASYGYGYIMHIGEIPSASGMFEEIIHSTQAKKYGEFLDSDPVELYAREVAANRMLLKNGTAYGFDEIDFEDIERNLANWEEKFKGLVGVSYDESNYSREI